MSYAPLTWVEKVTTLGPTNLNHLESGLQAAAAVADAALPTPAGTNGQFLKRVGGVWVPTSFAASDIPGYPTDATQVLKGDGSWTKPPGYEFAYNEVAASQTSTATASASAVAVATASAVTFDGATPVWVEFYCPDVIHSVSGATILISLYDGVTELGIMGRTAFAATFRSTFASFKRRLTPSAAAHTYSARMWTDTAGTATAGAGAGTSGVDVPLFIRITKA